MKQILDFARRVTDEFRPRRIILFGSHAYGTPRGGSDVDILVILSFRGNALDRATEILRRVKPSFSIDLLVRDPADTARRYRQFDPLIRDALDRGKVLYERDRTGVDRQGRRGFQHRPSRASRSKVA